MEADGRVSGDSEKSLHAAMMRRPAGLFPSGLAMRENFHSYPGNFETRILRQEDVQHRAVCCEIDRRGLVLGREQ